MFTYVKDHKHYEIQIANSSNKEDPSLHEQIQKKQTSNQTQTQRVSVYHKGHRILTWNVRNN